MRPYSSAFLATAFAAATLSSLPATAEIVTYTVSDVTLTPYYSAKHSDAGTLSGTFTINTTTDSYGTEDLTFTSTSGDGLVLTFDGTPSTNTGFNGYTYSSSLDSTGKYGMSFVLPGNTVDDYTGGDLCTYANICDTAQGGEVSGIFFPDQADDTANNVELSQFATGTASETGVSGFAPTPEPSSLVLLGTGALSLAGAARRRFRRS